VKTSPSVCPYGDVSMNSFSGNKVLWSPKGMEQRSNRQTRMILSLLDKFLQIKKKEK
jgi:hypothetical protein